MIKRKKTKAIYIGKVKIGDFAPISVQTMTKTETKNVKETLKQIQELESHDCEIVRLGIPDKESALALGEIKKHSKIPIIADIHFNYKFALIAIENGVDGLRLNPGNITKREHIELVVKEAKKRKIPIRIGVNSGSLPIDLLEKFKYPTPEAMVEAALREIEILENLNFYDIKISLKSSNVLDSIKAYRLISDKVNYPLHLGITESGRFFDGTIKSAIGIGALLLEGIGDTIRVSLADNPVKEVDVAWSILSALSIRFNKPELIVCPTCARVEIDVISLAEKVEKIISSIKEPIKIAVMGCVVNGPGEAKGADIAIAGGRGIGLIYKKGEVIAKVKSEFILDEFKKQLDKYLKENYA